MKDKELIPVYIRIVRGRTVCLCPRSAKRCKLPCSKDEVSRNKFEGWEKTMKRNRYGK